jgi:hypothetical protein
LVENRELPAGRTPGEELRDSLPSTALAMLLPCRTMLRTGEGCVLGGCAVAPVLPLPPAPPDASASSHPSGDELERSRLLAGSRPEGPTSAVATASI